MKKTLFLLPILILNTLFCDLSLDEKENINTLINTMATRSNAYLIFHRKELRVLGNRLMHLSPIMFFTHILTSQHRKKQLQIILGSYFTRTEFIDEAIVIFNNYNKEQLLQELEEFSLITNKNLTSLKNYTNTHDWRKFILYIAK